MKTNLPFIDLKSQYADLEPVIKARMEAVLQHGQYIMGPEVAELEDSLQQFTSAKHCIAVSSGTDALMISLMALGIEPGDEVITTPFTFIATVEVIVLLGAVPIFVDVEAETCNIDASKIRDAITSKTKAIMPVSLYGQCADMNEINQIAKEFKLAVIEDAAQSFGAKYQDQLSCNISTIGCTSFFPSKPLGCYGDGGALFTSDDDIATACKEIRVHGQSKRYIHTRVGMAARMDTLQCAIVLAKMERFNQEIEQRLLIGAKYNELIDDIGVRRVQQRSDRTSAFAQYTIFVENRNEVQEKLKALGVPTAVHYPVPVNEQLAYKTCSPSGPTPVAAKVSKHVMSLPMSPYLTEEQQALVVSAVDGLSALVGQPSV